LFAQLDINECSTNNGGCDIQATCRNTIGSFTCECNNGYQGNGFNCTGNPDHSFFFSKKKKILNWREINKSKRY